MLAEKVLPPYAELPARKSGLQEIDQLLRSFVGSPNACGPNSSAPSSAAHHTPARARSRTSLTVLVAPRQAFDALTRHVERRSSQLGLNCMKAAVGPCVEPFTALSDVAHAASSRHGAAPNRSAREVAMGLVRRPASVGVVIDLEASRFSVNVASELLSLDSGDAGPLLWFVESGTFADRKHALPQSLNVIELGEALDGADVQLWWEAAQTVGPAPEVVSSLTLEGLDGWWRLARSTALGEFSSRPIDQAPLRTLALLGAPWPVHGCARLGLTQSQLRAFEASGDVEIKAGWVHVSVGTGRLLRQSPESHLASVRAAATALSAQDRESFWSKIRLSELWMLLGDEIAADREGLAALAAAADCDARLDVWSRYERSLGQGTATVGERFLPFVEFALEVGDLDFALRFARRAAPTPFTLGEGDNPQGWRATLALGRSLAASGDLSSAQAILRHLVDSLVDHEPRPIEVLLRARIELAEVHYFGSDLDAATVEATECLRELGTPAGLVLPSADRMTIRLDANNVLGKLLLLRGQHRQAESGFLRDIGDAIGAGNASAELRARVNLAIAMMSMGRRGESQTILLDVLEESKRLRNMRASGLAFINLAVLATIERRYGEALQYSEEAVEVVRRLGDRNRLFRSVANLAELRIRLGLIDEAFQGIRFASRSFKNGPPPEHASQIALILGLIALERGDAVQAFRQARESLVVLGQDDLLDPACDIDTARAFKPRLIDALELAARASLEDGIVERANLLAERASALDVEQLAQGRLSQLKALVARAKGEPYQTWAESAFEFAKTQDDDELLRDACRLLSSARVAEGDWGEASAHLVTARAVVERVLRSLPESLKARYRLRREVSALSLDEDALRRATAEVEPVSAPFTRPRSEPRTLVGNDVRMKHLERAIRKVAPTDATVLIHGESGTGKELVAEALHAASARSGGPLVKVNCAALVESLLLSELFGHEKGAFTGASARKRGRFEAAEGGTLFLDEIGDITPATQVALLRVLQEKSFERVGATSSIRADVRVICATHRNLKAMVLAGEFREDLYYRLSGIVLEVPALRARLGDLESIATCILERVADERGQPPKTLSSDAVSMLKSHSWPGNVRELENALRAASLFGEGAQLEAEDFTDNLESLRGLSDRLSLGPAASPPPPVSRDGMGQLRLGGDGTSRSSYPPIGDASIPSGRGSIPAATPSEVAYAQVRSGTSLHDIKRLIERECIAKALSESGGNITRAATVLGMKRPRLSQLVKQYALSGGNDGFEYDELDCAVEEE